MAAHSPKPTLAPPHAPSPARRGPPAAPATPHRPTAPAPSPAPRTGPPRAVLAPPVARTPSGARIYTADPAAVGGVFAGRAGYELGRTLTVLALTEDGRYRTADGAAVRATSPSTLHRRYVRVGTDMALMAEAASATRAALASAEAAVVTARGVSRAAARRAERVVITVKDALVRTLPDCTVPRSTRGRPPGSGARTVPPLPHSDPALGCPS